MKLIKDVALTPLAEEYVAVPLGEAAKRITGVVRLNKTGKEIWDGLARGQTEEAIADALLEKYDGVDRETALGYIREIVAKLEQAGYLEQ